MFERFTKAARRVVVLAQEDARERRDPAIDTGHVLRALFAAPDDPAVLTLEALGGRGADVVADLERRESLRPGSAADGPDATALAALGIDLDEVRRRAEEAFGPGALDRRRGRSRRRLGGHIPFSTDAKTALALALREAVGLGHDHIGTEHVLLGMLRGEGPAHDVLVARGVRLDVARMIVDELVRGRRAG